MSTMVTELAVPLPYGTLRERGSKLRAASGREVQAIRRRKRYTIFYCYASTSGINKDKCKKLVIALCHLIVWEY